MRGLLFTIIIALFGNAAARGSAGPSLRELDDVLEHRELFMQRKQDRIDSIRSQMFHAETPADKLSVLNSLFDEYCTFRFDSTLAVVNRAEQIALASGDSLTLAQVRIHKALSLATGGHFSPAADILSAIPHASLPPALRREYFEARMWTYGAWGEYSHDNTFAPAYYRKRIESLDSLAAMTPDDSADYFYHAAERATARGHNDEALSLYDKAFGLAPEGSRRHAQIAYAIARIYHSRHDFDQYLRWMIHAAIADQQLASKEHLALQQLALFLKHNYGDMEHANRYLQLSLDDAIFYNNRLRMLEIAEIIPDITVSYQQTIETQNRRLKTSVTAVALALLAMAAAIYIAFSQIKKKRQALNAVRGLNARLAQINRQLGITNRLREQYIGLFIDLCAAYIDKLNRFPLILRLKVHNIAELSPVAERYIRPSEAEIREMFFNFDTAFLRLYPDFIGQFNSLLRPDSRITAKDPQRLNTDLRIYALVRMGITDSNKIASLLFYSPQTIFNHRTAVRNRAINRDTFESDVAALCALPSDTA